MIEVLIGKLRVRIINAYGPQETDIIGRKLKFYSELDKQIVQAGEDGCGLILQLDANAKIKVNDKDPHDISPNGKLFIDLIERNMLSNLQVAL